MNRKNRPVRAIMRLGLLLATVVGCRKEPEINWEHEYQRTADKMRVLQLHDLAVLVERFHAAKGYYPLTGPGATLPVDVVISRQKSATAVSSARVEDLERELSQGFGEPIALPRDPQLHDLAGFRQYHYRSDGKTYSVFTHLYFANPLTVKVDEVTHRYTLVPNPGPAAATPAWSDDDRKWMKDTDEIRAKEAAAAKRAR
jgi:hypothetical protein